MTSHQCLCVCMWSHPSLQLTGFLVPWPGIEPLFLAVEARVSLTLAPPGKLLVCYGSPSKLTKNEKENNTAVPKADHSSQSIFLYRRVLSIFLSWKTRYGTVGQESPAQGVLCISSLLHCFWFLTWQEICHINLCQHSKHFSSRESSAFNLNKSVQSKNQSTLEVVDRN